jgi:hypothetical protein
VAEKIPSWPKVTIRLYDDHNAEVKIAGRSHPLNHTDPRQAAIQLVAERAAQLGRPVKVTAVESDGASWPLVVHPDGQVDGIDTEAGKKKPIWPIVLAMVVAVVLLGGTLLYLTVFSKLGDHKPVATVSPKLPSLPGPDVHADDFPPKTQPPGYTAHADWTVDIASDSTPAIRPDGTEVAVVVDDPDSSSQKKLVVFDANGKVLWQDMIPEDSENPVYTTIDGKLVLAVTTGDTLYYWAGDGAQAEEIQLPDGAEVQFFGKSPLIMLSGDQAGAMVISGGALKAIPQPRRFSTILLAEGDRALVSRYDGPIYWAQPDKGLTQLNLEKPGGSGDIKQIVAASPDYVLVLWTLKKDPSMVIPVVHSTASGKMVAVCESQQGDVGSWDWVPGPDRKSAAWGECLINLSTRKIHMVPGFKPLSMAGGFLYGTLSGDTLALSSNWTPYKLTAVTRPWGIAGTHAIVVYDSVLFALDRK